MVFTSDVHLCLTVGGTVARVRGRLLRRHLAISWRREGGEAVLEPTLHGSGDSRLHQQGQGGFSGA